MTNTFLDNIPRVTRNLIIINVVMFLGTLLNQEAMYKTFALFYPTAPEFRWWQPLTHMFMHGGIWHIVFNMYSLILFGSVVERIIGERKFLILYFVCGFGAVALHLGVEWLQVRQMTAQYFSGAQGMVTAVNIALPPTVGASGAIYGLILAFAMLFPEARMTLLFPPVTLSAKWMVIVFAAIELFTGVNGLAAGIAHFAHLGGMLFGFLLILWWRKKGTLYNRY